jgi:hypothetical protein
MENITPEDEFPLLEQSSDKPQKRTVSYGIYTNKSPLYPTYKYVLLKFISFPPSTVIQRDEGFAILLNNVESVAKQIRMQGFAMFMRHPNDTTGLVRSFI